MTRFAVTVELEANTDYFPSPYKDMPPDLFIQLMKGAAHPYSLIDTFLIYSTKIVVTSLKEIAP